MTGHRKVLVKYPFKLSKTNIIYASIVFGIIIFLNIRIYGLDAYTFGRSLGSIIGIMLFPTLLALLFWLILGKKEKGGTTTFNVVLTLILLGSISKFGQIAKDRQRPTRWFPKKRFRKKESTNVE